ncbi:acylphosphatase [filamentous cyanobacterium LEGE 11480]|uniref:acylphosphatase n=2 Tax=Romeriopsis TaxID=2992131 RepID=A0A928VRF0_9CYAN|nr:acylphosphatase [Romeriopsis navalis LEGE 11480]
MICRRALISGRVQGVGYRYSTRRQAQLLGIVGWVQNLLDGRVEAVIQGDHDQLDLMVRWMHQGPLSAKVEAVALEEHPVQEFADFKIRR